MYDVRGHFRWAVSMSLFGALLLNGCAVLPVGFFSKSAVFAERQGGLGPDETITKTITYHRKLIPFDFEHSWIHDEVSEISYAMKDASGRAKALHFLTTYNVDNDWKEFFPVTGDTKWMGYRVLDATISSGLEFIVFDGNGVSHKRSVSCSFLGFTPLNERTFDGNRVYEFDARPIDGVRTVRYHYNVLKDELGTIPDFKLRYEALKAQPMCMEGHARLNPYMIDRAQCERAEVILGAKIDPNALDYYSVMTTNKYNEWNAFVKARILLHGMEEDEGFSGFIKQGVQLPKEKWSSRLRDHTRWERSNARPWWDPSTNEVPGMVFGQELGVDGVCYSKYEKGYLYYEAHVKKWQ